MKKRIIIAINLFIAIMTIVAWLFMSVLGENEMTLTAEGFSTLKFFTVLSNLFNGIVALIYARAVMTGKALSEKIKTVKLMATAAIGVTFLTVMVFLGPRQGFDSMFTGANFWLHLILPVLSFISYVGLERSKGLPFKRTFICVLPTFLYGIGYYLNIVINGIGEWPESNDFYGFMSWGLGVGLIIAVVLLLVTWLITVILYFAAGNGKAEIV